jgi:hypothetical protein
MCGTAQTPTLLHIRLRTKALGGARGWSERAAGQSLTSATGTEILIDGIHLGAPHTHYLKRFLADALHAFPTDDRTALVSATRD